VDQRPFEVWTTKDQSQPREYLQHTAAIGPKTVLTAFCRNFETWPSYCPLMFIEPIAIGPTCVASITSPNRASRNMKRFHTIRSRKRFSKAIVAALAGTQWAFFRFNGALHD